MPSHQVITGFSINAASYNGTFAKPHKLKQTNYIPDLLSFAFDIIFVSTGLEYIHNSQIFGCTHEKRAS